MTFDVHLHLGAVQRSVASLTRNGEPVRAVTLERTYDTTADDLWDALTTPERLPRWFAPVTGDFKRGGRFQIQGNASGEITACEQPTTLSTTWEFGAETSWLDVTLTPIDADHTRLTLVHTAPVNEHWEKFGPGAVGIGWELALLGLALHLSDPNAPKPDETTFHATSEGAAFITGSGEGWGAADIVGGETPEQANASASRTIAFYTGQPDPT